MRHSYYGDLQGSFEGQRLGILQARLVAVAAGADRPLSCFRSAPFVYAAFKAVEWRWWLSGIRFGGVRLESTLRRGALIGLYWKVIGWFVAARRVVFAAYLALCAVADREHERHAGRSVLRRRRCSRRAFRCWSLAVIGYLAVRAGAQRGDAGLSVARSLGAGCWPRPPCTASRRRPMLSARGDWPMRSARALPTGSTSPDSSA